MREVFPSPPLRVLIVDDCKDTRESLGMLLTTWGYEVQLAFDGPSALAAFPSFNPGVVLLDIGLPGMDGWEVARRMRQQEIEALLIAMTGCGGDQGRARSREAGFDAHLTKPARLAELRSLLEKAASGHALVGAA